MATTIRIKNSTVANKVPTDSTLGAAELAINLTDRKLYSKDTGGNVFQIGKAGDVPSGDSAGRPGSPEVGDQYFDTSIGGLIYWNGSDWEEVLHGTPGGPGANDFVKLADGGSQQNITGGGGLLVSGPLESTGAINGSSGVFTAKVVSASTSSGDGGTTLVTKDYLSGYATTGSIGNGTITIKQAGISDQAFTTNQSGSKTVTLVDTKPNNGTITISQPGTSDQTFTVDQSGNKTITLKNDNTTYSAGSYVSFSGTTINVQGSATNAANQLVARDGSGNFACASVNATGYRIDQLSALP